MKGKAGIIMKMLNGRTAVVTGGGSGMGQQIALLFAKEGAEVFILGRTKSKLEETVRLASRIGRSIKSVVCDVSNENEVFGFFRSLKMRGVTANVIVNCAGIINVKLPNGELDNRAVMNVNFLGTMNICDCAIKHMIENKVPGSIINIASIAGHDGSSEFHSYAASKGAILAYTKSIAMAYGSDGIRANSISPGVVVTPMSYVETPDYDDYVPEMIEMHPLGRLGKPEDVAQAALFFASDMSAWITGQDLIVDGGYTLRE